MATSKATQAGKPKKLTPKQTKFVKAYVETDGNGTQAALAAYNTDSPEVAHAIAAENLQKPTVKEAIDAALAKHGITLDAAIKPIADGLEATSVIVEGLEVPNHSVRLKASGMALNLMGATKQQEGATNFNFINVAGDLKARYE